MCPLPGRPALATSTSTSPASSSRRSTSAAIGEVARDRAAAGLGGQRLEHVRPAARDDQRRRRAPASARAIARPEAARGARDQGGASAQLHEAREPTRRRRRSP